MLLPKAMIFDIQRFSTHDGEGIRTTVFFKGCPLRCPWCENPESQSAAVELGWDRRKCLGCHDCVRAARNGEIQPTANGIQILRDAVSSAAVFDGVCPSGALSVIGREMSVQEVLKEIRRDLPFYRASGGGVTISGGEPYAQPGFLRALLQELNRAGVKTAVETCLQAPWSAIEQSLPFLQKVLADIKSVDAQKLKDVTGADLSLIAGNFRRLASCSVPVVARVPVIPGFNDATAEMAAIINFACSLGIGEIHFLPYHSLGAGKYRLLGRGYELFAPAVRDEELEPYAALARARGMTAVTGG